MEQTNETVIRIAIVDDDDIYCDFLRSLLERIGHFEIFYANDSVSTMALLANDSIDCVLIDYDLGGENGISIGQLINTKYPDPPPLIMLSGHAKERVIVMAFRGGFSDVVMKKGLTPDELLGAVRGAVERKLRGRSERSERIRLARMSSFDGITGLRTTEFMSRRASEVVESAIRRGGRCAAIIIRPHELETVGDTFGYVTRDRALRVFAQRLQSKTREPDICGQCGDDSFLYLIDRDPTLKSILAICERLSHDLCIRVNFDDASFELTPKLGAALFPDSAQAPEMLLFAANRALTQAQSSDLGFAIAPAIDLAANRPGASTWPQDRDIANESKSANLTPLSVGRERNRRSEPRQRVLKRGKIYLSGNSMLDCSIRDVSRSGAKLRLLNYCLLPDQFELLIVDTGLKRPVAVRWRLGADLGVQFLE